MEEVEKESIDLKNDSENFEIVKDELELTMVFNVEIDVAVPKVAEVSLIWKKFLGFPQQRPFSSPSQQYSQPADEKSEPRGILHKVMRNWEGSTKR